ncbi:MAG: bifunctional folylpolyglutamate synthase/dihydrofolate synthase, partial [Candidatus Omnitrophota bacterium]|nr:bifunctional folylpolyglutamate synthase/dihydrofolate synthase [Candidatus Omnitrophota bacterium]
MRRIQDFLALIGNPQKFLRVIHIAGTKGKGSTCALVAYILREAGFSVGLYTSPHLNDFRERIRILCPLVSRKRRTA